MRPFLAEQIAMASEAVYNVIDLIEGRQPPGTPYRGGTLSYIQNYMAYPAQSRHTGSQRHRGT